MVMFMDTTSSAQYLPGLVLPTLLVLVLAYLLGSISFSIILTKHFKHDDIRKHGSGNAGATNVLRTVGKKAALLTFVLDFLKCVAAVVLGRMIIGAACQGLGAPGDIAQFGAYAAGLACILGHIFPLFFHFRGGKGVVTTAAMMALVDWRVFLILFAVFIIVFAARKIVSLASIIGTALYPFVTFAVVYFLDYSGSPLSSHGNMDSFYLAAVTLVSAIVGAIVVIKHKENIKRLIAGTEKPIIGKKDRK